MRVEPVLQIEDAAFSGAHPLSHGNYLSLGSPRSGILPERANEIDLDFQRSVRASGGQHRVDSTTHAGIKQRGSITAMHRALRVITIGIGLPGENHTPSLQFRHPEMHDLADGWSRQLALQNFPEKFEAAQGPGFSSGNNAVCDWL